MKINVQAYVCTDILRHTCTSSMALSRGSVVPTMQYTHTDTHTHGHGHEYGLGHPRSSSYFWMIPWSCALCLSVDHCWVLLASGLAQEQSHYSRASNCRGIGRGKAVTKPWTTPHGPRPYSHGQWSCPPQHKARYVFYRWVGWSNDKMDCLRS